jgi:hypothetical protein
MKWIAKALVQKTISCLPFKNEANYFIQKKLMKGFLLSEQHFKWKVDVAGDHIKHFNTYGKTAFDEAKILELGTGWYPIVPISFFLSGCKDFVSLDINDWLRAENVITTIKKFKEWRDAGKLNSVLPNIYEPHWAALMALLSNQTFTLDDYRKTTGHTNHIMDARQTSFADNSFHYISSNNTFEHINAEILRDILKEFKRIVAKNGVMSHFVDMTDHFEHFDRNITIYNFLRFSQKQWQLIDNSIQPQNRLRYSEYVQMYQNLEIQITEAMTLPGDEAALHRVKLHQDYTSFTTQDLAISHCNLVSVM